MGKSNKPYENTSCLYKSSQSIQEEAMKYKFLISLLLVFALALTFQSVSGLQSPIQTSSGNFPEGTAIHVDIGNNSGMEDGSLEYPFNTIQDGLNVAVSGDVVGVAPGTYYEHVILKVGIQLVGTEPTSTIIDGSGSGIVVTMEDASLLKGLTIQHGSGSFGAGIVTRGSPTIKDNIIQNNTQNAGGAGAAIFGNISSPLIANNIIRGNTADTQFLSGAISFINASSPFIVNNIITDNTGRGAINLTVPEGNQPTVVNNTIVNNVGAGIKLDSHVTQFGILVADNILVENSTGIQIDSLSPAYFPRFEFNDIYGNSVNYFGMPDRTGVDGNISVDPMFSTAFHLNRGSPLIDAGSVNYFPSYDFDGDARPLDGNGDGVAVIDIGADEHVFVDNIAPVIAVTALKEDGTEYVADTWTNQTVTVKFTCSDNESGIDSCPVDAVLNTDSLTSITGVAIDKAGNSASIDFGPVKIDKTPPVLFIGVSPNPVLLNGSAQLLQNAVDDLSGVRPGPCMNVDTSTVGFKSVTCWISDNAGNITSTTVSYQVIYDFEGFLSPVIDCVNNSCDPYNISFFNVGTPISLKFRLKDANGKIVLPANAPLWLTPFNIEDTPPVYFPEDYPFQVTSSTYTWKKNVYVYDWSTKKLPARTVWLVGVKLDDGKTYYVFVALK
jgi:hypothetical protein